MAQEWLKKYLRIKPEVHQIFDDLEEYRLYCRDNGKIFDEAHLYVERSPWGEMRRVKSGRPPRDPRQHWNNRRNDNNRNRNHTR